MTAINSETFWCSALIVSGETDIDFAVAVSSLGNTSGCFSGQQAETFWNKHNLISD